MEHQKREALDLLDSILESQLVGAPAPGATGWPGIARYLSGELEPEERETVEAWIMAGSGRREAVAELERRWKLAGEMLRSHARPEGM